MDGIKVFEQCWEKDITYDSHYTEKLILYAGCLMVPIIR